MVTKALLLGGVAAVAATASLPAFQAEEAAPRAAKGDRLAISVSACATGCAAVATTMIPAGQWITIEQPAGEAGSVLIRVPVADVIAAAIVSRVFPDKSGNGRTDPTSAPQRDEAQRASLY